MIELQLPESGVFEYWRAQARDLALQKVRPDEVSWRRHNAPSSLLATQKTLDRQIASSSLNVPQSFLALAREAACYRAEDVFNLLYSLLLRVANKPDVMSNQADPDLVRLHAMAKSVRRDTHKMKAFVRFRELPRTDQERRRFAAWFEPEHYIVEHVAGFFTRRFADMDWLIATPRGSLSYLEATLSFSAKAAPRPHIHDDFENLWRSYYRNIFNPARLKVKAMQAEMPKKYWKNLPEAALIPGLIKTAGDRAKKMRLAEASVPPTCLGKIKAPVVQTPSPPSGDYQSLAELHENARHCRRCDLCLHATQTVCGEGPDTAKIMFVGEQPGDREDIKGRPFVGPAGELFAEALLQAGLSRSDVYVTNAVKHFKFMPRGKRRIHQRPNNNEIEKCRWWLMQEVKLVKPGLLVAMGATALYSLTGDGSKVTERRSKPERTKDGRLLMPTIHPSAILRNPNAQAAKALKAHLLEDMKAVAAFAGR